MMISRLLPGRRRRLTSWAPKMAVSQRLACTDEILGMTVCRGVRGATTVEGNDRDQILLATRQLLGLMIRRNDIDSRDVASVFFTVTKDLTAEYPALAARQLGWLDVPLLCGYEIAVDNGLPRCIRVLMHWNTDKRQSEISHVYLRR